MMQDFVRLHMMSMLQPFAERVQALQEQLRLHGEALREREEKAEQHEGRLVRQEMQISSLLTSEKDFADQLEKAQLEVAAVKKERNRLEGNHEITKAAVAKLRDDVTAVQGALDDLTHAVKESSSRTASCQSDLPEVERRLIERFDTRLDKQGRACKDLNERMADIQKQCQQAKTLSEKANLNTSQFTSRLDASKKDAAANVAGLQKEMAEVREVVQGFHEAVQSQSKDLGTLDREVQHLRTWTEQLKELKSLQEEQAAVQADVQDLARRLSVADRSLADLAARPNDEGETCREEIRLLQQRIDQNIAEVLRGKDAQKAQLDLLGSASNRLEDLEAEVPRLRGQVAQATDEVEAFTAWQSETGEALRSLQRDLRATEAQSAQTKAGLTALTRSHEDLQQEQTGSRETLGKLGSRLDLLNKYFSGLGKGLKEAHHQIVGCDAPLLPKTGGDSQHALPPLVPRTPRTARNSLPSPRPGEAK